MVDLTHLFVLVPIIGACLALAKTSRLGLFLPASGRLLSSTLGRAKDTLIAKKLLQLLRNPRN